MGFLKEEIIYEKTAVTGMVKVKAAGLLSSL